MKNLKIALLFVSAICLFVSCDELTSIQQPGELTPEQTFQTVEDLQNGLNGVYQSVSATPSISFNSIFTDEVRVGKSNSDPTNPLYEFQLNTNSGYVWAIWQDNLAVINYANRIIQAADNVVAATEAEARRKQDIVAQCHILRAYGHFELLTYFSENLADNNAWGCQKMDFVPTIYQQIPRSTNKEVFDLINSDLAFESQLIDNKDNEDRIYISQDMVKAFRARMALYREDYTTALTLADELIGDYPLTPRTDKSNVEPASLLNSRYVQLWKDLEVAPDEVIFKLKKAFPQDEVIGQIWAVNDATLAGFSVWGMSTDLYQMLYNPAVSLNSQNDIRANVCISSTSRFGDNLIVLQKYRGGDQNPLQNDFKVYRTSEMYFIKAEALANAGDFNGVKTTLQGINVARYKAGFVPDIVTPTDAESAWALILTERRKELCYEGHRWVDLKRLGKKAKVGIERNPADCNGVNNCSLPYDSFKFTMPIPQRELDANPSIRSQQNKGY